MPPRTDGTGTIGGLSVMGTFAVLIISQLNGSVISNATMVLLTAIISSVSGYFFGSRGVGQGAAQTQETVSRMASTRLPAHGPTIDPPPPPPGGAAGPDQRG